MSINGCFLFRSEISINENPSCVSHIAKFSRNFNKAHDIIGILIFDGQRFVQYMEGLQEHLLSLIRKVALDPRHTKFSPLHQANGIIQRFFTNWELAYVSDIEADPLSKMWEVDGKTAVSCLLQLLPQFDSG